MNKVTFGTKTLESFYQVKATQEPTLIVLLSKKEQTKKLRSSGWVSLSQMFWKSNDFEIETGVCGEKSQHIWHQIRQVANERSGFERRWLISDWFRNHRMKPTQPVHLHILLDEGSGLEELGLVEDLITLGMSWDYLQYKWSSVRVDSVMPKGLASIDPSFEGRFQHQLQYRQWVNENPDSLTSIEMGKRLAVFAKDHDCDFVELREKELEKQKMSLLLAVGQGAKKSPSRLFVLSYGNTKKNPPLVLVGKGITFDSGGINLKPHESFVNCMKNDMGGAGLFANLFMGLVKAKVKQSLVLVIPACENAIDAESMKPGTVHRSRSGKTVILEHTDAEGRLILCDAMNYIYDQVTPKLLLTAATLTTASLRQFGNYYTPIHFLPEKHRDLMSASSTLSSELLTHWSEFIPFARGNLHSAADLTNLGRLASHASMGSGSNVAAHFLKQFAKGDYGHMDIFNTIWNWSGDYPGAHYGCTGSLFNTMWRWIEGGK